MKILSAFSGGLFLIPLLTLLGGIYFMVVAYKASKSGSQKQDLEKGTQYSKENVPIYKTGQFIFACALFLATIGIVLLMINDR